MAPPITIQHAVIPRERCVRNLGLYMDEQLRFESHVQQKVASCYAALSSLYKLRPYISCEVRSQLCHSLVLSHLYYCDLVYGPCLLKKSERMIQKVQNSCIRYCYIVKKRDHITPHLVNRKLLNMARCRNLRLACFLHSLFKYESPQYLFNRLDWKRHRPNLRDRGALLEVPICNRAMACGCFTFAASKLWNDLPPPVRRLKSQSLRVFKEKCFQWFLVEQRAAAARTFNLVI